MQNLKCHADRRNKGFCVHCGGPNETDDHVPSKVLLDEPYPENLMVCPSCLRCNNSLSDDEVYLACLLECVIAGEVDPLKLGRSKIGNVLSHNEALVERLKRARTQREEGIVWNIENNRIEAVVLKLARCHAAYEYNEPSLDAPARLYFRPLITMCENERELFEHSTEEVFAGWPEVGSRAMQRLLVVGADLYREGWLLVQIGNYRYRVSEESGLTVRIVLREYLACEVTWE
jgi:hypothetical protein